MLAKIITAGLTAALAYMVIRQLSRRAQQAAERVKPSRADENERIVNLREDPDTGIFRPSEQD